MILRQQLHTKDIGFVHNARLDLHHHEWGLIFTQFSSQKVKGIQNEPVCLNDTSYYLVPMHLSVSLSVTATLQRCLLDRCLSTKIQSELREFNCLSYMIDCKAIIVKWVFNSRIECIINWTVLMMHELGLWVEAESLHAAVHEQGLRQSLVLVCFI